MELLRSRLSLFTFLMLCVVAPPPAEPGFGDNAFAVQNCAFFTSNSSLWSRIRDITAEQAQILLASIAKCNVTMTDARELPRFGQLLCFFDDFVASLDPNGLKILLTFLSQCAQNTMELQKSLGQSSAWTMHGVLAEAMSARGLSVAQIANLSSETVEAALERLGNVTAWSKAQLQAFIRKINVTEQKLLRMGSLIGGLSVEALRSVNGSVLMKVLSAESLSVVLDTMSSAQRSAIVSATLKDSNVSSVLSRLPDGLLRDVPLSVFRDLESSEAGELLRRSAGSLNRAQILALMKKIPVAGVNSSQAVSALGPGVGGLSCDDVKQMNAEALAALGRSSFASRYLIQCAAKRYFQLMSLTKAFSSLTPPDLSAPPPSFLLYEPPLSVLQLVPPSICPHIITLIGQADIKLLPRSSARRADLLTFMKSCLNASDELSSAGLRALGSLVCVFGQQEVASLSASAFIAILEQLKSCGRFDGSIKEALRQQILLTYNDTGTWTQEVLQDLDVLIAALRPDDLSRIPNTEAVKVTLTSILSSAARDSAPCAIPEYNNEPDVSALTAKLSQMYNNSLSARRRRTTDCSGVVTPSSDVIAQLGEANVGWTSSQLFCLPDVTFAASLDILASVSSFSIDQLTALKVKSLQVFGPPITNEEVASLKRINLAFTEAEVASIFPPLNTDTLSEISGYREWATPSFSSRSSVILGTFLQMRPPADLTPPELVALGYFLCAMPLEQIALINSSAYRGAAWSLGDILCPDAAVLAALKDKAVEVFGGPGLWTADVCQEVGAAIAGLSPPEVSQLSVSVMPFLRPECIALIPPDVFSAFSVAQLMNFGPENSLAVSESQRRSMSSPQLDALSGDLQGPPNTSAGIARLSVIGSLTAALIIICTM